jgi:hypothetical protein
MASADTIAKMELIVEAWEREDLTVRQKCVMVLGLQEPLPTSAEVVKKQFVKLKVEIHPDKTGGLELALWTIWKALVESSRPPNPKGGTAE